MASVTFRLRTKASKRASIYVLFNEKKGSQFLISTGFKIDPKYWNVPEDKVSLFGFPSGVKDPNIKNLITYLLKLKAHLLKAHNIALGEGIVIDKDWVVKEINGCFGRSSVQEQLRLKDQLVENELTSQIQDYIDHADTYRQNHTSTMGLSVNRVKGIKTFKNTILQFEKKLQRKVFLKEIDFKFEQEFNKWLLTTKKYSVNYAGKIIDNLKTISNYAKKKGIEVNPHSQNIKGYKQNKKDRIIQILSFEELKQIANAKIDNERLDNARNWLLFGCNIGQRGQDLLNITLKNFVTRNGVKYIELTQEKTNKDVVIPITKECESVLKNGIPYKISSQKLNKYIKEVCEIAGLTELVEGDLKDSDLNRNVRGFYPKNQLITSHSFRRSFCSNYYITIPTPILMEITQHGRESVFLDYIGKPKDKDRNANLMLELLSVAESNAKETTVVPFRNAK